MKPHIGNEIRNELRRKGYTNAWLAEQIGVSERSLQRMFNKKSIDTQQLLFLCEVLETDFFALFSQCLSGTLPPTSQPLSPTK